MLRRHKRGYFYKFMSVSTAMSILKTSTLRYRSPNQFNDPFDHQVHFKFPFTTGEFSEALLNENRRVVYDDTVNIQTPTEIGAMMLQSRQIRDNFSPDELAAELRGGADATGELFKNLESVLNKQLIEWLNHSRVFCVTEELNNVVMWAHYAGEHKGVAIQLKCLDEVDNTLLVAQPVRYTNTFPTFPPLTEYIRHLTGEAPLNFGKIVYEQAPYIKHKNWAYEKEWRVHVSLIDEPVGDGYNDWKEDPKIFGAIYFGCRIDPIDAQSLVRVIETKMPHMQIFQSETRRDRFGMKYNRMR